MNRFKIVGILNLLAGVIHTFAHLNENIITQGIVDIVFIIVTQYIVSIYLITKKEEVLSNTSFWVCILSYVSIFVYSVLYHFILDTADNINHTLNSLSGNFFDLTTIIIAITQLIAIYVLVKYKLEVRS